MTLRQLWNTPGTRRDFYTLLATFAVGWPVFTLLCAAIGD